MCVNLIPKWRDSLESLALASVGISLIGSLGYCIVGVVTTLTVEHFGWFNILAVVSEWMLSTLHIAAYIFAVSCILATFGASGMPMRITVPVTIALPFCYGVISYGVLRIIDVVTPFAVLLVSNLWWVLAAVTTFILVCFAACTSPRNGYGYVLFGIFFYTVVIVGLCVVAVFTSTGFASWSPWIQLALSCGIAITWFSIALGLLKFLTLRWPPSAESRKTFETWLVPLSAISAFLAAYAVWLFAVEILGYEGWLAKTISGLSIAAGLTIAGLLVLGSIVTILGDEEIE